MFIHLNTHSDFSMLKGALKIPKILELSIKYDMPAVALTDSGNLCGLMEFVQCAKKSGIQPIIGCEISVILHLNNIINISLLIKNDVGYRNLLDITQHYFCQPIPIECLNKVEFQVNKEEEK